MTTTFYDSVKVFANVLGKTYAEQQKIQILREAGGKDQNSPFLNLLVLAFHPVVGFDVPQDDEWYKSINVINGDNEHWLRHWLTHEKYVYFVKGTGDRFNIPEKRRLNMFLNAIENMNRNDASLVIDVARKKFPFKEITYDLVQKAFPRIFPVLTEDVVETEPVTEIVTESPQVIGPDSPVTEPVINTPPVTETAAPNEETSVPPASITEEKPIPQKTNRKKSTVSRKRTTKSEKKTDENG